MGNCHPRRTRGASGTCRNCFRSVWGCQGHQNVLLRTGPWGVERAPTGSDRPQAGHSLLPFIAGHKAHVRYPGQPRTCFRCGETGHEAKGCPNKKCGRCLRLGMIPLLAQAKLCAHSGEGGHVFSRLSLLLCLYDKEWGSIKGAKFWRTYCLGGSSTQKGTGEIPTHLVHPPRSCRPQPRARTEKVSTSFPHQLVQFRPQSAAGIARSGDSVRRRLRDSVVIGSPEALSDSDSGGSVIVEPNVPLGRAGTTRWGNPL
ncbi:hypothetical protein BSL78_20193 [Apostichopus japonicus]|uniref:CCHC-type domain-containing protein n=1 Tax=Stichopus japonicus TaxID=307972 RepID=A0A2G8K4L5_STIJA|nr:hypothetical protein BSL78_20193 [Apostichopus japonicus]